MEYKIVGQTVPALEVTLSKGESMVSQNGGMAYQTEGLTMSTNAKGGLGSSIGRMFSGESIFLNTYTADRDGAMVAFGITVPGNIIPVDLATTPAGLTMQKGAYLCSQPTVTTKVAFTKKFSAGLFGGEGFILQQATGSGMVFLEVDGDPVVKELAEGEVLKVDTGNVCAFDSRVKYEIETVKGIKNIFLGGEGLFLTKLTGPGKVILQTQNIADFAGRISRYIVKS